MIDDFLFENLNIWSWIKNGVHKLFIFRSWTKLDENKPLMNRLTVNAQNFLFVPFSPLSSLRKSNFLLFLYLLWLHDCYWRNAKSVILQNWECEQGLIWNRHSELNEQVRLSNYYTSDLIARLGYLVKSVLVRSAFSLLSSHQQFTHFTVA